MGRICVHGANVQGGGLRVYGVERARSSAYRGSVQVTSMQRESLCEISMCIGGGGRGAVQGYNMYREQKA